jgi:hypothetical protein
LAARPTAKAKTNSLKGGRVGGLQEHACGIADRGGEK